MSGAAGVGHLSIGEVLSLVQEDFPDVTISKIRFLESQGLIAPERTAAGYRKFYDSDIERLRWILRQQRDHFLPLKVIRKMLDQGVDVSPDSQAQPTLWSAAASGPTEGHAGGEVGAGTGEDADAASGASRAGSDPSAEVAEHGSGAGGPADRGEPDDAARSTYRSPAHPAVASARSAPAASRGQAPSGAEGGVAAQRSGVGGAGAEGAAATPAEAPQSASPGRRPESTAASGAPEGPEASEGPEGPRGPAEDAAGPAPQRPAFSTPADVVAALQEEPRSRRGARGRSSGRAAGGPPHEPSDATEGATQKGADVRMTRMELCEATGLAPDMLADLEDYGLVQPTVLGGDPQYDAAALEVARIAARYAEMGVGARHLRMYKVAAEREAGFVEQLVVPLLKQRNPAAREQAEQRADELQQMGAQLHAALLHRRLGPSFGR